MLEEITLEFLELYKGNKTLLDNIEDEYERFLSLINNQTLSDKKICPSKILQNYWRFHFLHTKEYNDYCKVKFDKFIHYQCQPYYWEPYESNYLYLCYLQNTIEDYKNIFGDFINSEIWESDLYERKQNEKRWENLIILRAEILDLSNNYGIDAGCAFYISGGYPTDSSMMKHYSSSNCSHHIERLTTFLEDKQKYIDDLEPYILK